MMMMITILATATTDTILNVVKSMVTAIRSSGECQCGNQERSKEATKQRRRLRMAAICKEVGKQSCDPKTAERGDFVWMSRFSKDSTSHILAHNVHLPSASVAEIF